MKRTALGGFLVMIVSLYSFSECIMVKPLNVRQICGKVRWAGAKLRLTRAGEKSPTLRRLTAPENGDFSFSDLEKGDYWLYVAPGGTLEAVPVQLRLNRPLKQPACKRPIELKVNFIPEPCVSPTLQKSNNN